MAWCQITKKTLAAMRMPWIPKMAMHLPYSDGNFVPLGGIGCQDDFDNPVFMYIVVDIATDAGATRFLPERDMGLPYDLDKVERNYEFVIDCITAFSAQITPKCRKCFPNIFERNLNELHPLNGLHEWAMLFRAYNEETVIRDPDHGWKTTNAGNVHSYSS